MSFDDMLKPGVKHNNENTTLGSDNALREYDNRKVREQRLVKDQIKDLCRAVLTYKSDTHY